MAGSDDAADLDALCGLTRYGAARAAFRRSAERAGAEVETIPYPAEGPGGEALAIDAAFLGARDAPTLAVFVTGIHGVEAPCGTICLVDALESGAFARAAEKGVAFLLVHPLNPWGYAWDRRANENGVDLNRNFRLGTEPIDNPFYAELKDLIVPRQVTPFNTAKFLINLLWYRLTRGYRRTEEALIGGQHVDPFGIYYTGEGPQPTREMLDALLRRYEKHFARIVYLDVHSGLGKRGKLQLLFEKEKRLGTRTARRIWPTEASVISRGDNVRYARALFGGKSALAGTLEFGTYHEIRVLLALRADHALHKRIGLAPDADEIARLGEEAAQVKTRLRNAFAPRDPDDPSRLDRDWAVSVTRQFRAVVRNIADLPERTD